MQQMSQLGVGDAVETGNDFVVLSTQGVLCLGGLWQVFWLHVKERGQFGKVVPTGGQTQQQRVSGQLGVVGVAAYLVVAGLGDGQAEQVGFVDGNLNHEARYPVHRQTVEPSHRK